MSKGGAGKVYFVLYLAVILELLIIIVERDEAEEHLIRKQKEAEEIVEAVMAQLNTGFGASGVNALPQDEITLLDPAVLSGVSERDRPKDERTYQVRVSTVKIKDILGDDLPDDVPSKRKRIKEIIQLFNVQDLKLLDSLNESNQVENLFLKINDLWINQKTDEIVNKIGAKRSISDAFGDSYEFLKAITPDSLSYGGDASTTASFRFSPHLTTLDKAAFENGIKVFEYTFKQKSPGLYRVNLSSKTNNILGVSGIDDKKGDNPEDVISIGTIQLSRKQLAKVEDRLQQTFGSKVEALCNKFETVDAFTYQQYSQEMDAEVASMDYSKIGVKSKSDMLRRAELLKNITVLLHGDANQMEQNNPTFRFEVFVKKPTIERAEPCIADLLNSQRVLSGVSKVVIPFTVNNYRGVLPTVTVTPSDVAVKVIPLGQAAQAAGGARNQPFEIHVEGVSTTGGPKTYTVKFTNVKLCDESEENVSTIAVFPSELANKGAMDILLDKRVTIGKKLRLPVNPSAGGEIPANQYEMSYTLNGQVNTFQGTNPLQVEVPCVPKSTTSLNVKVKWRYKPIGSQYTEDVVLYDKTVSQARQGAPEIDLSKSSESWDAKALKLIVSGIKIESPRIDCGQDAPEKDLKVDVKLDKPSVGKYNVFSSIEPEGSGSYRVILQLKGPRMKFAGDNIELAISAGVAGATVSENKTVSIPEFR
ncbi:MAG: hypothetical protein ACK5BQ_05860 [Ignavibacteria bacterium]|jgi:hypothetical protein